ncbi:MAG: pirin family protein [Pseudomonadota bacterium]
MMTIRHANERGQVKTDWLHSRHSFSFGHYYDPKHLGFGPLKVINEDEVAPGRGFETHGHRDMEIISYVLDGALKHQDSLGTGSIIRPGDIQRMSAGTGVLHSEFNASNSEPVRFLQIWVEPESAGLAPGYEQKSFLNGDHDGQWRLVGSRDGRDGSVVIHQDLNLYTCMLSSGDSIELVVTPTRQGWLQVARGAIKLSGCELSQGDGMALTGASQLRIEAREDAEMLWFDMATAPA